MSAINRATLPRRPYQAIAAQAWAGMLAILVTMLVADLTAYAMQGRYDELSRLLANDPGPVGLQILVWLICANALFQVALRLFDQAGFRRFAFWVSVGYTAFFVLHQTVHLAIGDEIGLHTVLDLTHHALGIGSCWALWRWCGESA